MNHTGRFTMTTRHHLISWLIVGLVSALAACDSGTVSQKKAESFVEDWAERTEESLDEHISIEDAVTRFESTVKTDAKAAVDRVSRTEPPYDAFIRDVYTDLGWKLRLASNDGLTDRGATVWKILQRADEHALDLDSFEFDTIETRLERVEKFDEKLTSLDSFTLDEREHKQAVEWLTKQKRKEFELEEQNFGRLVDAVTDSKVGDRLATRLENLREAYRKREKAVAGLEQLLARNVLRYSRKMEHFRIRHVYIHPRHDDYWSHRIIEDRNPDLRRPDEEKGPYAAGHVWRTAAQVADDMKQPVAILHERMRETLRELLTDDTPAEVLEKLQPNHPQYAKLQKEYARYRKIVDNGGWEKISQTPHLGRGTTHEVVSVLKKRLSIEEYYPEDADTDNVFDADLEEAIEQYQTTHQMRVTGKTHRMFWVSVNTTAEYRVRQLGLNLERWRESNVRHGDPTYAMVNIPGFHVELWHDQKRDMRFEIVVGNNDTKVDEETDEEVSPNHTPELSAYIDRVIYNPYWNVTDRIRNNELLPKARHSVEQKYKARLRELRKQKRELADVGSGDESETTGTSDESSDSYFVSAGTEASDDGSESSISSGPLGGPGDGEQENQETEDQKDNAETKESKVAIDDLFQMVEDENAVEDIDKKAVFDVQAVRKLINQARKAEQAASSVSPTGGGMFGGGDSESGDDAGSAGGDSEEGDESVLEREFPYLDPETGEVDVSSTNPDNVPDWYEENDYEVMAAGKDWEYIRMTQGEHNALGRVKVIFPNQSAVYLHDTPKQDLFSRKIRAFSHGCMRMHKPLQFAEQLLRYNGKFDEIDLQELLEGEKKPVKNDEGEPTGEKEMKYTYKPVFLDRQIPVHIEYFTVRVDEEGRANFFADIYDKDEEALTGGAEGDEGSETDSNDG
jgi:murein L,D-transpeptidase YcbB/YkuD